MPDPSLHFRDLFLGSRRLYTFAVAFGFCDDNFEWTMQGQVGAVSIRKQSQHPLDVFIAEVLVIYSLVVHMKLKNG